MVNNAESLVRARKVFPILIKVFSVFFFMGTAATIISLVKVNDLLANSTHTSGEVISLKNGAKGAQAPVVRFKTASGETLELESSLYTSPAPNVGDTVRVVYRTATPQDWLIDDWIHLYFWTLLSAVFMVAWGIAITITKLAGDNRIRRLEGG